MTDRRSFLPSSPPQSPSLTCMALTARAAAHAVEQLKRGELEAVYFRGSSR